MYYSELFQPVLSCALHMHCADADPCATVRAALRIAAEAMATARAERPAQLDNAWFPVCVWLDEQFTPVWQKMGDGSLLRARYFHGDKARWNFYVKLDRLLAKGVSSGTRRDIALLYYAVLRLGYKGTATEAERYDALERCRLLLEAKFAEVPPAPRRRTRRFAGVAAQAMVWLVPIGSTIALYCVYRHFLTEWFARM